MRDLGLVVIAHCGYDHGFPDEPMSCGPAEIAALLAAVPGLGPRFVAAHLGGRVLCRERSQGMSLRQGDH